MRRATRTMLALVSVVLLLAAGLAAQRTDSAQALLRAAADKAVIDGDLNAAIKQYQTIVDTHILNLRKKIEPAPARPQFLHSVRGIGYRFDG